VSSALHSLGFRWSSRHLPVMSEQAWEETTGDASALARDERGDETLRSADGSTVIKVFRLKRLISSALWRPYALRFVENAAELARRGIAGPDVTGVWRRERVDRHLVTYRWREGRELRGALAAADAAPLAADFGRFLALMHERGAHFRTLHLGNVLVTPQGFSLIDIVDVRCYAGPVPVAKRGHDVRHACAAYEEDAAALERHAAGFLRAYFGACTLDDGDRIEAWAGFPRRITTASGLDAPPGPTHDP
jgi:tRNA A-37 threonylcarbamoyl transferase component Bud32